MLADAVVAMRSGGWDFDLATLDHRMPGIVAQATAEIRSLPPHDRALQMELSVIGTISYEVAVAALRRLALEHASGVRFGD
jgi:hypothetical protein